MVRPVRHVVAGDWKALLALAVITGGLLWHVLACVESPMAFSPNGKDLAFVTMEPYEGDGEKLPLAGTHTFRLMVLVGGKELRTLEETSRYMLSAPGWSPDGKSLAYLRIPLFTKEQFEKMKEATKKSVEQWDAIPRPEAETKDLMAAIALGDEKTKEPGPQRTSGLEDQSLPPVAKTIDFLKKTLTAPKLPALLVIRNAASGEVTSLTQTEIVGGTESLQGVYLGTRPQYSPDGKAMYLCAGNVLVSISSDDRKERGLAAPVLAAALSPDGAVVATIAPGAVGFVRTSGESAVYRRIVVEEAERIALCGLAWTNAETLAFVTENKDPNTGEKNPEAAFLLQRFKTDGSALKPIELEVPPPPEKDPTLEMAASPDGKHALISYGKIVYFLKADGKLAAQWKSPDESVVLAQPTFTPDSSRVAFKKLAGKEGIQRVSAIVFFTPDGKEVSSVEIPPSKEPIRMGR